MTVEEAINNALRLLEQLGYRSGDIHHNLTSVLFVLPLESLSLKMEESET